MPAQNADIQPSSRIVLQELEETNRERLPQADLIKTTDLSPAAVSSAVNQLTSRGLAKQIIDPTDARRKIITLPTGID